MWVFYQVYSCFGLLPFSSDLGEVLSVFRFFLGSFDLVCIFVGFCPFGINSYLSKKKKKTIQ